MVDSRGNEIFLIKMWTDGVTMGFNGYIIIKYGTVWCVNEDANIYLYI